MAAVITAVTIGVAQMALPMISSDWRAKDVLYDLSRWEQGEVNWTTEEWQAAERKLLQSLAETPRDAVLLDALAHLYALRGSQEWTGGQPGAPELVWFAKALEMQKRSIELRPTLPTSWANRAIYESTLDVPTSTWLSSWEQARRLGPNEITVRQTLRELAVRHWDSMPPSAQAWVKSTDPQWEKHLAEYAEAAASAAASAETAASSNP